MKILGVCGNPINIMIERLEFSLVPFGGGDIKLNSLDKLLDVLDSENLLSYFSGIGNSIARQYVTFIKMI